MFDEQDAVEDFIRDLLDEQGWRFIPGGALPRIV